LWVSSGTSPSVRTSPVFATAVSSGATWASASARAPLGADPETVAHPEADERDAPGMQVRGQQLALGAIDLFERFERVRDDEPEEQLVLGTKVAGGLGGPVLFGAGPQRAGNGRARPRPDPPQRWPVRRYRRAETAERQMLSYATSVACVLITTEVQSSWNRRLVCAGAK